MCRIERSTVCLKKCFFLLRLYKHQTYVQALPVNIVIVSQIICDKTSQIFIFAAQSQLFSTQLKLGELQSLISRSADYYDTLARIIFDVIIQTIHLKVLWDQLGLNTTRSSAYMRWFTRVEPIIQPVLQAFNCFDNSIYKVNGAGERIPPCLTPLAT